MPEKRSKFASSSENFRMFGECSSSDDEDQDNVKTEILNGMRMYQERLKLRRRNQVIRPLWWRKANEIERSDCNEDATIESK